MECKHLKIILFSLSAITHNASADEKDLNLEPLAMANISCAAFYGTAQVVIKPEFTNKYASKFSTHYALSHQLSSSYGALAENLNKEAQRQAVDALSFKEKSQIVDFLSKNTIKCGAIEAQSADIIKNNPTLQNSIFNYTDTTNR